MSLRRKIYIDIQEIMQQSRKTMRWRIRVNHNYIDYLFKTFTLF